MNRNGARFDYVFLGLGAANSLILRSLDAHGLLRGHRFAIFEPDAKRANDRTFCFWAEPAEVEALGLLPLVSHAWDTVRIGGISETSILPMRYWHICGIDLYEQTRALLDRYPEEALLLAEPWEAYADSTAAGFVFPFGKAQTVFDSRPPQFQQAAAHEAHLLQSFLGWEIECPAGTFDTSAVVMMDFRIPQEQHTQFVYILPFSDTNALVEVTRFGTVPVQENEAADWLAAYLAENFPTYRKLHLERGVIPMSSVPLRDTAAGPGWVFTGSRADRVKPSTGYAFHAMARDAQQVAKAIAAEQAVRLTQRRPRFVFYDRLLLKILEQRPQYGKAIFQTLFRRSALPDVLHFLSEKTRFAQDLNILRRLPFLLFFSFALRDIFQRLTTQQLWPLPLAATLLLLACNSLGLAAVSWSLIGAGLLLIGIPHGALDHLAHLPNLRPGPLLGFVALYLAAIALCAVVWAFNADLALLFFLAYTAWHFGQADLREAGLRTTTTAFLWGLSLLGIILLPHADEAAAIIRSIGATHCAGVFSGIGQWKSGIAILIPGLLGLAVAALAPARRILLPALLTLLAGTQLPLLQAFAVYFIAQHSLNGWKHLQGHLHLSSARMWLHALPFTLGALFLGVASFLWLETPPVGLFFIALSCLSFPHVLAMDRFYIKSWNQRL